MSLIISIKPPLVLERTMPSTLSIKKFLFSSDNFLIMKTQEKSMIKIENYEKLIKISNIKDESRFINTKDSIFLNLTKDMKKSIN